MAIEGLEEYYNDNFSQGLDYSEDARNIGDSSTPDCANIRFIGKSWTTRPGYFPYLNNLGNGGFLGFDEWAYEDALIAGWNGDIYKSDNGTWGAAIHTGLDTSAEIGFIEYLGDIYFGNGVDDSGRIEHTTYTVTNPAGMPKGDIWQIWAEKMWSAGDPDAERTLSYSKTASAANPEYIYDFANEGAGTELIGKRGILTGLDATKNALIIFKDTESYYVRTFNTESLAPDITLLSGDVGCVGRKAYTRVGDDVYFFSGTEIRIVSEYQGYPNLYTASISPELDKKFSSNELDADQSGAVMAYNDKEKLLKLWLKTNGANQNDICFVYHLAKPNRTWTIDTGKPAIQAITKDDVTYWASSAIGQIWRDEFGLVDDLAAIKSYRYSKINKTYSAQGRKKGKEYYLAGTMTADTEIIVKLYMDGFLYKEYTITADDIVGNTSSDNGPIGVDPIGTVPIAGVNRDLYQFEFKKKINRIFRYIQTYAEVSIAGGYAQITDEAFRYIPMPRAAERNY